MSYDEVYSQSLSDPDAFWGEAARSIHWDKPWDRVLDTSNPPFYRWFVGAELNTCYNLLDRHVEAGRGDQAALIYDSPVTGVKRTYGYRELLDEVALFAGALAGLGVTKGDRVIIYMPMVPEALIAIFACARLGAIHSVVFGGFSSKELATRIEDAKPKVIVAGSCGIEPNRVVPYKPLVDQAIELCSHEPEHCVLLQREQGRGTLVAGRDLEWAQVMADARPHPCVPVAATDPLYILYTSGTTGIPKGVVHDNGGHAVAMYWTMRHIYNMEPGEVFWAASDVGWVVGHSYIVYAPLLYGCTTLVYEGKPVGTPDAGAFWRVISEHKVAVMFTAPTALRAIKRVDSRGELVKQYDLSHYRAQFLAGERCDPDTLEWAEQLLGVPVIDHWWQTETAWAIASNFLGIEHLPVKPGSPTKAVPGYDVRILDEEGTEQGPGQFGRIMIKLPLPPGCLSTLWGDDERYRESYLNDQPGYYLTGDAGLKDEDGYLFIMSRIDDIINVAGHRLSTGAIEEVLASHADVAECAVIGAADTLKGELPVGLVVLKDGVEKAVAEILKELVDLVRAKIGPVASFKQVTVVERLPKTRSGKVLRGTMKRIADGRDYRMPATIDDPEILNEIEAALREIGYAERAPD